MRLSLRIAAVAAAVLALGATASSATAQELVVSSQVISDEVVKGTADASGTASASGTAIASGTEVVAGDGAIYGPGAVYGGARTYGQPDLFYNYYTQGYSNAVNAQMYVSPLPVPPYVGHTFMTYQPLQPEHYLYWHQDRYHNYYDGGRGLNRTKATYYSPPVRTTVQNVYWNWLRIPR